MSELRQPRFEEQRVRFMMWTYSRLGFDFVMSADRVNTSGELTVDLVSAMWTYCMGSEL